MSTITRLPGSAIAGLARHRDVFADVDHVDECGAPVLAADHRPIPCENGMPGTTPVAIFDAAGDQLTTMTLQQASRAAERGIVTRTGVASFQLRASALRLADGPGLTPNQARRRYLAAVK